MPWSGGRFTRTNGVNTGATLWAQDRDDGTKILATRHDTNDQDMADGINSTLEKSGSNAATGNLDIGSNRITLVADGTAKTDVATVNQIQSNGPAFQATDTGTANTYVIALTPAITAYAAGQRITFKAGAASTTASTLNVNTLGTKAIKKQNDQDIASGDIESGSIVTVVYDGTSFQMTSQLASASTTSPGGSNTQVQYNSSSAFAGSAHFTFDGTSATVANPLFLPDGSASAPALSNTGDTNTGIAFIAADTVGVVTGGTEQFRFGSNPIPGGSKNLLINGETTVAQRGTVTDMGNPAGPFFCATDMWRIVEVGLTARFTSSQDTTSPAGFGYSLKCDCTTAETGTASGDILVVSNRIEAQNLQHLQYGAAAAESLTLSFWFRSPKTGIHCVSLYQYDGNRSYVSEFTISSADTFEFFSITIPGDASGTINNDTGQGLEIAFPFVAGSNWQASADAWASGQDYATSNQQNLMDNTANNVYIAGVQLEVGSVATDFAHEDVGTTLQKCKRYFERLDYNTDSDEMAVHGGMHTTTSFRTVWHYAEKRAAPTLDVGTASDFVVIAATSELAVSGMTFPDAGPYSSGLFADTASTTLAYPGYLRRSGTAADAWIEASAEL